MTNEERILRQALKDERLNRLYSECQKYREEIMFYSLAAIFNAFCALLIAQKFNAISDNADKISYAITGVTNCFFIAGSVRNMILKGKKRKQKKQEWRVVDSQSIEDIKPEDVPAPDLSLRLSSKKKDSKKE